MFLEFLFICKKTQRTYEIIFETLLETVEMWKSMSLANRCKKCLFFEKVLEIIKRRDMLLEVLLICHTTQRTYEIIFGTLLATVEMWKSMSLAIMCKKCLFF